MKDTVYSTGLTRKVANFLRRLITIYRTRHVYGDNSVCMRMVRLFAGSRNSTGAAAPGMGLQY